MDEKYSVIPGADTYYLQGGDIGILISHGFMGTPQSVSYIGEQLNKLGFTILAPRIQGHGTHYKDLEKCTKEDWFQSLERGYIQLAKHCSTIFVFGQSMGGTLALHLAHRHHDIAGIVLINPALTIPSLEAMRGKKAPRWIAEAEPDIKAENVFEITYDQCPLTAIHELQQLMDQTPAILQSIHTPVLAFKSAVDHVVPPENTDYIIDHIGTEQKATIILKNSYHVASMDNDKDKIVEQSNQFIKNQIVELMHH